MSALKEFVCLIPDKPGALQTRLDIRNQHLTEVRPLVDNGTVVMGGGMLESHPEAGQTPPFKGSVIVVRAESENAAREVLKGDVYARSGVWDLNAVQIIPFMCAVRVGDRPLP